MIFSSYYDMWRHSEVYGLPEPSISDWHEYQIENRINHKEESMYEDYCSQQYEEYVSEEYAKYIESLKSETEV